MDVMNKHQLSEDEKDFIINCTKFGVWILGQPLDQQYDTNAHVTDKVRVRDLLDELTGDDLKDFRGAGANPEYEDERLFESKEYTYYGINDWVSMLATHEGRLYKNGIRYLGPTKNVRLLFDEMIKLFPALDVGFDLGDQLIDVLGRHKRFSFGLGIKAVCGNRKITAPPRNSRAVISRLPNWRLTSASGI